MIVFMVILRSSGEVRAQPPDKQSLISALLSVPSRPCSRRALIAAFASMVELDISEFGHQSILMPRPI